MLPARFVALERLPLTPSGKLDRAALPAPGSAPSVAAVEHIDADRIGVRDNFFDDLGGDSLGAVELMNELEELLGRELPIELALDAQTIEDQAVALRGRELAT